MSMVQLAEALLPMLVGAATELGNLECVPYRRPNA